MILKVKFTKPAGASIEDVAEFVADALSSWGGGLHPEDPMFRSLPEIEYVEVHGVRYAPAKDVSP